MAKNTMDYFQYVLIIQLVFAFSITMLIYSLPSDSINYVENYETEHTADLKGVSSEFQGSVESQRDLPLLDLGAMVFYSGNILIDLIMRFFFAIPEMVSIVIGTAFVFIGVDPYIVGQMQLLIWAVISAIYMLSILRLLMNIRSRGAIV
jgi:hypothetical protein